VAGYLLLFFLCFDFLNSFCLLSLVPIVSNKSYSNTEADKATILKENKNKSGIYMFKNLINAKRYIGSSVNLSIRFLQYFNTNYLQRNTCMIICRALLKHDYSNFSLTILEYCEPSKCLEREKYYIYFLGSEYNTIKDPTIPPMSGRKHSDETRKKMSDAENSGHFKTACGENHPMLGQNHSDETIQKMSDIKKGENHPMYGKPRPEVSGRPSQAIEVTDNKTNDTTTYDSISAAARALNIDRRRISEYFARNQQKPYKGQYTFKNLEFCLVKILPLAVIPSLK
jgi:group I intron endonuclease